MTTALKFTHSSQDIPGLLNTLRGPLPTATSERLEAELMEMDPRDVMEHVRHPFIESPYLLAALAPVLAGWQRRGAEGSGLLLQSLIELSSSSRPLMVRIAAIDALGQTGTDHPVVLEQLRKLLNDSDPGVCTSAQDAIENLGAE